MCEEYKKSFPNAHIHAAAVPPVTERQIELNKKIDEYAKTSNHSFIDNKELFDRRTKKLRPHMLNGIHYTDHAFKEHMKAIRRSLYSKGHNREPYQPRMPAKPINENPNPGQSEVIMSAISELTKTTQAILQKIDTRT